MDTDGFIEVTGKKKKRKPMKEPIVIRSVKGAIRSKMEMPQRALIDFSRVTPLKIVNHKFKYPQLECQRTRNS